MSRFPHDLRFRFLHHLNSIKIGRKKKCDRHNFFLVERHVTRSVAYSHNNLVLEPNSILMADPRMELTEKQNFQPSMIQSLFEDMINQNTETAKIVAETAKGMTEINKRISKGEN